MGDKGLARSRKSNGIQAFVIIKDVGGDPIAAIDVRVSLVSRAIRIYPRY